MIKQEKLSREEALDTIRRRLNLCFGSADGIFANHPLDRERAYQLRTFAFKNDITLQEVLEIAIDYFEKENFGGELAEEQMKLLIKMFKVKLK